MWITVILIIVFSALSAFICYYALRPHLKRTQKFDEATAQANADMQELQEQLLNKNRELMQSKIDLEAENRIIDEKIKAKTNSLTLLEEQAAQSAEIFYKQNMSVAQTHLELSLENERKKYCREIEILGEALEQAREEEVAGYLSKIEETKSELVQLEEELAQRRADTAAAINAAKRAEEMKESRDFYRIKLTDLDIEEIKMLRSVAPYLRDKEPLNKVIWKVYYEKPVNDLIGRVIGPGIHTGIYKITDIENEKCYVGQAVKLADEKLYLVAARGFHIGS